MRVSWEAYIAGKPPEGLALVEAFRDLVMALGDVELRVHATELTFARKRGFAACFLAPGRLEICVHLLREIEHPCLLASARMTRLVWAHRLRMDALPDLDESIRALVREAWETVGPGTRQLSRLVP